MPCYGWGVGMYQGVWSGTCQKREPRNCCRVLPSDAELWGTPSVRNSLPGREVPPDDLDWVSDRGRPVWFASGYDENSCGVCRAAPGGAACHNNSQAACYYLSHRTEETTLAYGRAFRVLRGQGGNVAVVV